MPRRKPANADTPKRTPAPAARRRTGRGAARAAATSDRVAAARLRIEPLTASNFPALERLFGANGACGGCWCMTPRLGAREYAANKGENNRRALAELARRGPPPGVLVFSDGEPIGWCAIAPRAEYRRLAGSRVLAPVDATPVWSITCLFVAKAARKRGVSRAAIEGAAAFARSRGARIVEAYPIDPKKGDVPPVFAWTGLLSAYLACGFREVARRSETRPIVRRDLTRA